MRYLTIEQAQISEEIDELVAQRQHLETLDFTNQVETQHEAIEAQIKFLTALAKEIQNG
jgi:hypothetical protein